MKLRLICVSVSALLLICVSLLFTVTKSYALTNISDRVSVVVTATVGEPKLTIFGYTSPFARVQLSGIGVAKETEAADDGYFLFSRVFLPSPSLRWVSSYEQELAYPDLSLIAIDTENRSSFPVSLPPLPTGPYEITVGPILMSPTITLQKGKFSPGEQILATGQTIPNSQVAIFLANEKTSNRFSFLYQFFRRFLDLFLPRQAQAYFLPQYQIAIESGGHFQFNLPSVQPNGWRVFATTTFLEAPSAKSNTLAFEVLSWWGWLLEKLLTLIFYLSNVIKPYLLILTILIEIITIVAVLLAKRNL